MCFAFVVMLPGVEKSCMMQMLPWSSGSAPCPPCMWSSERVQELPFKCRKRGIMCIPTLCVFHVALLELPHLILPVGLML